MRGLSAVRELTIRSDHNTTRNRLRPRSRSTWWPCKASAEYARVSAETRAVVADAGVAEGYEVCHRIVEACEPGPGLMTSTGRSAARAPTRARSAMGRRGREPTLYGGFTGDNTPQQSKDGHPYLTYKDPVAVAPSARPYRTITVIGPPLARLLFAAPSRWATLSGIVLPVLSRSFRLSACSGSTPSTSAPSW